MSILFIADVHLSNKKPKVLNGFLNFLNNQAIKATALYILGDLFEVWLGDDDKSTLHIDVARGLKILKEKEIPCYFIRGNHDFLLGSQYANACGMTLLPNYQVIRLSSGKNIIVLHGDLLCVNDKKYLRLKKILNYRILQKFFLSLPFFFRLHIFNFIYNCYNKYKKNKLEKKLNIDNKVVVDILMQNQSEIMIHGHTHQLAIHNIHYSKYFILKRIELGGWTESSGSVAQINEKDNSVFLKKFSLDIN